METVKAQVAPQNHFNDPTWQGHVITHDDPNTSAKPSDNLTSTPIIIAAIVLLFLYFKMKTLFNTVMAMAVTVLIVAGLIVYNQNPSDQQWPVGILCGILVVGYLLPTFIAFGRGHSNAVGIMIFNIFLGWTFVSWVWCLISACATMPPVQVIHQGTVNYNVSGRVDHYPNRVTHDSYHD